MKLSDVVAAFLVEQGIRHAFAVSGGASLHLIHSIAETEGIELSCPLHEQAGAYAADGYARVTGNLGCAIATSGPGATNLLTGICSSYYDSVPVLYLTGQVATFRSKGDTGVRQIGFQETDMVDICRSVTKYSVLVTDPYRIRYELQKAVSIARQGRPGPVLVDIPDDLQRMDIDPSRLVEYVAPPSAVEAAPPVHMIDACLAAIRKAERPVLIVGWGVHLSRAEEDLRRVAAAFGIPVASTWAATDIMPASDPLCIGGFGTHGTRHANFAVQNADLVIAVGSRLDTKATGTPPSSFAREAFLVMQDIDPTEIGKFTRLGRAVDVPVPGDAGMFLRALLARAEGESFPPRRAWLDRIDEWKARYAPGAERARNDGTIDPYALVGQLSGQLQPGEVIVCDTGCALAWMMQAFRFKAGQRFFHAFNNTPMGYALPAAVGAALAVAPRRVVCIVGDGSLQMSIAELASVVHSGLPVKIILFDNQGHAMVRQTQQMWLGGNYYATSPEGGLPCPDLAAVARAYGLAVDEISEDRQVEAALEKMLASDGPYFLVLKIARDCGVSPQVKFGRPNEDADPLLDREEFLRNMIIQPLPVSLNS